MNYISTNFDTNQDGKLRPEEIADIKSISISGEEVYSPEGMQYFHALKKIECHGVPLKFLNVSANKMLEELWFSGHDINFIDVKNNTELNTLFCSGSRITFLDLSKNTKIHSVYCDENCLAALDLEDNSLWNLGCGNQIVPNITVSETNNNAAPYQLAFSSLGISPANYIRISGVSAQDLNGKSVGAKYDSVSGIINFVSKPAVIKYVYSVQYNKLVWDYNLACGVPAASSMPMNVTLRERSISFKNYTGPVSISDIADTIYKGKAYDIQINARGIAPLKWELDWGTLPDGLTLSSSGKLSGTPKKTGQFEFNLRVYNNYGSENKTFKVRVADNPAIAPVITNTPKSASAGREYLFNFKASGTVPITYSLTRGTLPGGLTLSKTGILTGRINKAGTYNFTITASNAGGSVSKNVILDVAASPAPPAVSNTPGSAIINRAYNFQFKASGANPITYSLVGGSLPNGITLSKTGALSGRATRAETYNFTVTAYNAGGIVSKNVQINILTPPVIKTSSLPKAQVKKSYNAAIKVSGSTPMNYKVTGLPKGLKFDSKTLKISGKPSSAKTYSVKITVSNSAGQVTQTLKLVVSQVKPKLTGSLASGVVNKKYTSSLKLSQGTTPIT